ncbi:hypothetical protein L3X38_009135 [Prunus dulcis]|uniref:RNase H type-1 domain-containing protein n=1 Tax=Prunus dulcis TaxID=3755 RepID=A0AAD5F7U7_PRUDU|nr:hypothetical protein L3X38_009135 [Prunus dulcis]
MKPSEPLHLVYRPGACKINSDGSRNNATGFNGAGGLLRDATGAWIHGFTVNLGAKIECDSSVAVALLSSPTVPTHPFYNSCCKMKIREPWCCAIEHIYREQNVAADALATRSYNLGPGLHVYDEVPDFLEDIPAANAKGTVRPRSFIM